MSQDRLVTKGDKALTAEEQRQWLLGRIPTEPTPKQSDFLSSLTELELANLGLTELPSCLPEICPQLSILFCPKNNFVELPAVVGRCANLQMVSFKGCNSIERIHPDALQPQLRWLILTGNRIEFLPDTIGRCSKLQKFMLSGNRIRKLPPAPVLQNLQNLELIRLACNRLEEPPVELLESCKNLRWAAFAGNPFLERAKNLAKDNFSLPILDDPNLDDDSCLILGKGAGGVTRKVPWKEGFVAVKTFAGELTSDGSPQDEKAISKLVCSDKEEPALIDLLGETTNGALVMELLENYKSLAGPPSMATCSRDVYREDDLNVLDDFPLWKIAMETLRVLCKMHALGVTHGDFYAHNILIRSKCGSIKVSDFGAAFRYRYGSDNEETSSSLKKFGQLVQSVEVRAYAVLVAELLEVAQSNKKESSHPWSELLTACNQPDVSFGALATQFNSK